ncbi:MAG: 5'/3'-nucleotidase SurE [Candidatus Kapaibacterium sp.]
MHNQYNQNNNSEQERPYILVTNDDGIDSPGINALVHSMQKLGDVVVVAPDRQQSAVGHALTVAKPLRITPFHRNGEMFGYAIDGTPADCVKLALSSILDRRPDIVVSGINHGQNTSINILYSGTVSAATEGMLLGIPSMAISLASHDLNADMSSAAKYSEIMAKKLLAMEIPEGTLLNVNIPAIADDKIKGIKFTRQSGSIWKDSYEKRIDPFSREYYWFAGEYKVFEEGPEFDDTAVIKGFVSVTPIQYRLTNMEFLETLSSIEDEDVKIDRH